MIRGGSPPRERTYHKQAGAAKAYFLGDIPVAFAVAGHHGGIPNKVKLAEAIKCDSGKPVERCFVSAYGCYISPRLRSADFETLFN